MLDGKERVIAVGPCMPSGDGSWSQVERRASSALEAARKQVSVGCSESKSEHRRGKYIALGTGISFGGGQVYPRALQASSRVEKKVLAGLLENRDFIRMSGFSAGKRLSKVLT